MVTCDGYLRPICQSKILLNPDQQYLPDFYADAGKKIVPYGNYRGDAAAIATNRALRDKRCVSFPGISARVAANA